MYVMGQSEFLMNSVLWKMKNEKNEKQNVSLFLSTKSVLHCNLTDSKLRI